MKELHLYKAKTTKKEDKAFDNVWVIGSLVESDGKYYIKPNGNYFTVENEITKNVVMHEVIPETIGQCTGVRDKNGTLIFGNDIVRVEYSEYEEPASEEGRVEFIHGSWFISGNVQHNFYEMNIYFYMEVIGNAYDDEEM